MQLTQEQVSQLSDEELDAYARVVIEESRSRRAKIRKAKCYRGRQLIPAVVIFAGIPASWISSELRWEVIVAFFFALGLMQWHASGLNRRIDALLDLLDLESSSDSREAAAPKD